MLGIRSVSHSTFQPQCRLSDASHILYWEYELALLPSPPKNNDSVNSSMSSPVGYGTFFDRSNFESNVQAQHGIEMYPEAEQSVPITGTQGVSSSAWLPMRNTPGWRYGC